MEKKYKKFIITTDNDMRGLGYNRLKDDTKYIHTICIFVFIICWTTPVKIGEKQIAKQISNKCVEINGKLFDVKYYSIVNNLRHIYYRNKLGSWIKTSEFHKYNDTHFVVNSPEWSEYRVIPEYDVYLFSPNAKLEGYVYNNTFYAVKELSVG